ncbi:MAG TPA: DUF1800 domain-containing protein [Bacteroidia bacterium]|nr:DUF1800 domain-containing protein [Bacteroidia bacterium]
MSATLRQIFHLYNRLGFGISYSEAKVLTTKNVNAIISDLFTSASNGTYLSLINKEDYSSMNAQHAENNSKEEIQKIAKDKMRELNIHWMKQLIESKNILLEKQTLFWHDHFACRASNPYFMQELNNIHRKHAFSSFRELLIETAKSPAMLQYLNNQQSRKEHPNENFARELLELFTLGKGNYTEQDIKETARAFTGWGFDKKDGQFTLNQEKHDTGEKIIFGMKGNFGGEDVINMILGNKKTAYHITRKIYRYYVNEEVKEAQVKELAEFYFANQYNTGELLKKLFSSPWFLDEENIGCKIKSPVEFLVGISRQFKIKYNRYESLFKIQELLGQKLFYPPNVSGWPKGRALVDSSTLLLRMRVPSLLLSPKKAETVPVKKEIEGIETQEENTNSNSVGAEINWEMILNELQGLDIEMLQNVLLAKTPLATVTEKIKGMSALSRQDMIIKIVSLPEYSLL